MKRARHTPRPPMLVMRGLVNDRLEMRERSAIEAFALGYATDEHFDTVAQMQGVLILEGCTSEKRRPVAEYARDVLGKAMESIRDRYHKTGKLGCNADELKVLRGFVSIYRNFWLRQPMELYEAACLELQRHYDRQAESANAAA